MSDESDFPGRFDDSFFRRLVAKAHFAIWRAGKAGHIDAVDVAGQVFMDIYRMWLDDQLDTTDPQQILRGLANTMIRRRAIDARRRGSGRFEAGAPDSNPGLRGTAFALDKYEAVATTTWTRIGRIDAKERVRAILDFVSRLDESEGEDLYELLILHEVDGFTFQEIAEHRGRDERPEALRSRLRRLKKQIQKRFEFHSE